MGNVVSATPSGGWIMTSPVIPELGFPLGTRLQMASLDPAHPNALAPGKRPRTTLSPSLAQLADGRWLAFGTPGGDQQDQWTSQFFLRLAAHGERDLQAAIDAPTVHSEHMPSSFWPRQARPGVVHAESRLDPAVLRALEARGHRLDRKGPWDHGRVLAAAVDPAGGPQEAAASPRFAIALRHRAAVRLRRWLFDGNEEGMQQEREHSERRCSDHRVDRERDRRRQTAVLRDQAEHGEQAQCGERDPRDAHDRIRARRSERPEQRQPGSARRDRGRRRRRSRRRLRARFRASSSSWRRSSGLNVRHASR
jgi:hypothetical protein